jgi:hypothetical protein
MTNIVASRLTRTIGTPMLLTRQAIVYFPIKYMHPKNSMKTIKRTYILACTFAGLFLIMTLAFFVLLNSVDKRHNKIVGEAAISNAIVSSLFPANVRKRLFKDRAALLPHEQTSETSRSALRSFLKKDDSLAFDKDGVFLKAKPIADLFDECTVMC